jgi:hypothetical protein
MGALVRIANRPRYMLRTVLIVATWMSGALFAAHVPDDGAQRRAEELAPIPLDEHPAQPPAPATHRDSRPGEAPPLLDPPSPTPA